MIRILRHRHFEARVEPNRAHISSGPIFVSLYILSLVQKAFLFQKYVVVTNALARELPNTASEQGREKIACRASMTSQSHCHMFYFISSQGGEMNEKKFMRIWS